MQPPAGKMSTLHAMHAGVLQDCGPAHCHRRPPLPSSLPPCRAWGCVVKSQQSRQKTRSFRHAVAAVVAAVVAERAKPVDKIPTLPFVKIAGQEDMKLAILLNVVDPKIGGVLIMGDRGTGKSVAVSACLCLHDYGPCCHKLL